MSAGIVRGMVGSFPFRSFLSIARKSHWRAMAHNAGPMDHSFLSALILLLLVLDPLGSLPIYIPIMNSVPKERRRRVALREVTIAFAVLLGFMFAGEAFLRVMHLSERSLEVAGGVILLMVAIYSLMLSLSLSINMIIVLFVRMAFQRPVDQS